MTILDRGRNWFIEDVAGEPQRRRFTTALHDLFYQDDAQQWQAVDENLADDTTTGFANKVDRMRHIIRIGSTGTRRWIPRREYPNEYVEFGRLQSWSGSAWQNVNLGTPTRSGNKIAWSTTSFDLSLTVTWKHVKILAVLKTETARRRLRWSVVLYGLTWNNGTLYGADGLPAGEVERPIAWDANGSIDNQNVTITTTYSAGYLEFGGDLSAAVLPITIDPTLDAAPGAGGDDGSFWSGGFSNDNNGLWIGDIYGAFMSAFIRFPSVTISNGATIDSAKLILGGSSGSANTVNVNIRANDATNPAAPTTNAECVNPNRTTVSVDWDSITAFSAGTDYDTPDISAIVQELVNSYDYSSGAAMVFYLENDGSSSGAGRIFYSYNYGASDAPVLHVEYTEGGAAASLPILRRVNTLLRM
jgi:hypothetical protein